MNFRTNILLIVAIVVAFLLINFSLNPKPSGAQQNVKWEYKAISYDSDEFGRSSCVTERNSFRLNEYGEQGWELILYHDVYRDNGEKDECKEAVFKRRLD